MKDRSITSGVSLSGAVSLREGRARTRVIHEGSSVSAADLVEGNEEEIVCKTSVTAFSADALVEILTCFLNKQTPVHAVILDVTVFWTITLTPVPLASAEKIGEILRSVEGVRDLQSGLQRINVALGEMGRVEKSLYVILDDPSLAGVYDFFRRKKCDVDWVKRQVYGVRLVHVPETFPPHVATPEDISKKIIQQRERGPCVN